MIVEQENLNGNNKYRNEKESSLRTVAKEDRAHAEHGYSAIDIIIGNINRIVMTII